MQIQFFIFHCLYNPLFIQTNVQVKASVYFIRLSISMLNLAPTLTSWFLIRAVLSFVTSYSTNYFSMTYIFIKQRQAAITYISLGNRAQHKNYCKQTFLIATLIYSLTMTCILRIFFATPGKYFYSAENQLLSHHQRLTHTHARFIPKRNTCYSKMKMRWANPTSIARNISTTWMKINVLLVTATFVPATKQGIREQ